MATSVEHAVAYGQLRAALLLRHFALRRYWRADLLSTEAQLAEPGAKLRAAGRVEQVLMRWKVVGKGRGENALLFGGMVATFLAVEAAAGHRESVYALRGQLHTLGTLYPYEGDGFDGCPVRWDPYTSELWEEDSTGSPVRCSEFFAREGGGYWPVPPRGALSAPSLRPDSDQATIDARHGFIWAYRRVELSQDELVGLVAAYSVAHQLVDDDEVRRAVRGQAQALGDYLGGCGYHLVRPRGDFSARGAAGVLPAFEYPYARVFRRITGRGHASRVEFPGALQRAGVWEAMAGPYAWASVVGFLGRPIVGLFPGFDLARRVVEAIVDADVLDPMTLARAWQINEHSDVFDVSDADWAGQQLVLDPKFRQEFVLSFLLGVPAAPEIGQQPSASRCRRKTSHRSSTDAAAPDAAGVEGPNMILALNPPGSSQERTMITLVGECRPLPSAITAHSRRWESPLRRTEMGNLVAAVTAGNTPIPTATRAPTACSRTPPSPRRSLTSATRTSRRPCRRQRRSASM